MTKYKLVTECASAARFDVLKEYFDTYGNGQIVYISYPVSYHVEVTIDHDPELDGSEYELFKDTVRNLANMGWPEYDPYHVEVVEVDTE